MYFNLKVCITHITLLRVVSDLLHITNNSQVILLSLLDLSLFNCIDHNILLQRLKITFGIDGKALQWIKSVLTETTQQIYYNCGTSSVGGLPFDLMGLYLDLCFIFCTLMRF